MICPTRSKLSFNVEFELSVFHECESTCIEYSGGFLLLVVAEPLPTRVDAAAVQQ